MNKNILIINDKIKRFSKSIKVDGDKSLSIRWVLFSSIAKGLSVAKNLLLSEDVLAALQAIKKLGIKVKISKNYCSIIGKGINGYKYKKNIILDAKNSGTLGRLILGLLIDSPYKIKLIGDNSLSKRDFERIALPLRKFGANIKLRNNKYLPLTIQGSNNLKPIKYFENKGSAQCKSSVILAALKTTGKSIIKAKKSRNHTELLCKNLNLPVKVISKNKFDYIEINKVNLIKPLKYSIPSDISSSAFFIVLTVLSKNSKILIKNVNINPSRTGIVTILRKMGANIKYKNIKNYNGELVSDIYVKSTNRIKPIKCPRELVSGAIDEFLIIFLVAAKADGISYFKGLAELNQKESPRLIWGEKILNLMGVKTITTNDSIKIYGNPKLSINKKIVIKDFLKDHRVFMTSVIAALSFGGYWKIHNKDSVKTSFPSFLNIINELKN